MERNDPRESSGKSAESILRPGACPDEATQENGSTIIARGRSLEISKAPGNGSGPYSLCGYWNIADCARDSRLAVQPGPKGLKDILYTSGATLYLTKKLSLHSVVHRLKVGCSEEVVSTEL